MWKKTSRTYNSRTPLYDALRCRTFLAMRAAYWNIATRRCNLETFVLSFLHEKRAVKNARATKCAISHVRMLRIHAERRGSEL